MKLLFNLLFTVSILLGSSYFIYRQLPHMSYTLGGIILIYVGILCLLYIVGYMDIITRKLEKSLIKKKK